MERMLDAQLLQVQRDPHAVCRGGTPVAMQDHAPLSLRLRCPLVRDTWPTRPQSTKVDRTASAAHDQTVQSILEGGYPALTGLAAAEPAWATLWSRRVGGLRPRTPVS